jgi:DNA-binding LytR/AlgR family response regulator
MQNTKILIVEDEVLIAEDIKDALISFGILKIEMAHSKTDAFALINSFQPDLILLDIRMEGNTDGLDIANELKQNGLAPFVFITSHSDVDMIKEIIKTNPAGYITKPFKKSDLFASINLAFKKQTLEGKIINIKDGTDFHLVNTNDILFIKSDGNYVEIHLSNSKRIISRIKLETIQQEISNPLFIKVGKSYIVNGTKVDSYNTKELIVAGQLIPVSRNYYEILETQLKRIRG